MVTNSLHTIQKIKEGDKVVFEKLFTDYYPQLVNFAYGILKDKSLSEEQVQEVFAIFWEKRLSLRSDLQPFPYLLTAVRNKCINIIDHRLVNSRYVSHKQREYRSQLLNYDYEDLLDERIAQLHQILTQLPERCKEVFELSRFEGLSHKAIESRLGISTKTIENHITKALSILKRELKTKIYYLLICVGFY